MRKGKAIGITAFIWTIAILAGCSRNLSKAAGLPEEPLAFPGAEGFGRYTTGGRGGKVLIVNNLNDSGEGSFRAAAIAKGARIIVFEVSGTIHLATPLNIKGDVTIAGQTAPGDGICLADNNVSLAGDNVIIRYLRFRMGDRYQNKGMVDGAGSDDAFTSYGRSRVIIDHCSFSWSTDEVFSVYNGDSVTLQWNLIAEPLNYSYHFEKGDTAFENHGYGAIWGGRHLSAHHNLFAHCASRNPRFNGVRTLSSELVDYRNNVIYNWGHNNIYAGEGGTYNLVGNYYRYGPSTHTGVRFQIVNPTRLKSPAIPFGKFYVRDNFVDGSPEVTMDNQLGVRLTDGTASDKMACLVTAPFEFSSYRTVSADQAYAQVLASSGASWRRDTLDQRIIEDVKQRRGRIIDVQGGYPHGTPYEQTVNAWPALVSAPPDRDTDRDGMPDAWESEHGLNPNDKDDARENSLNSHYTNIEVYINSIVQ